MPNVAIVSTSERVNYIDLQRATKAIAYQIKNHVAKFWNPSIYTALSANITAYEQLEQVPFGSWLVEVADKIDTDSYGYHYVLDKDERHAPKGTPYARIKYDTIWSLILSHEVIELLINPYLTNFRYTEIGGKKVRLVVEPSDPAQFRDYGYLIDGVLVSDFTTPNFYDLVYTPNTRYSYTGQIKKPLELLENGYFSFQYLDRLEVWFQMWKVRGQIFTKNLSDSASENQGAIVLMGFLIITIIWMKTKREVR